MSTLNALLASYYLCDAAASQHFLDHDAVVRCAGVYQAVKAQFLSQEELEALGTDPLGFGGPQGNVAYLRFSAWKAANPDLVARLRGEARARLHRQAAATF